jgi:hypothetical protein
MAEALRYVFSSEQSAPGEGSSDLVMVASVQASRIPDNLNEGQRQIVLFSDCEPGRPLVILPAVFFVLVKASQPVRIF